MKMIFQISELN